MQSTRSARVLLFAHRYAATAAEPLEGRNAPHDAPAHRGSIAPRALRRQPYVLTRESGNPARKPIASRDRRQRRANCLLDGAASGCLRLDFFVGLDHSGGLEANPAASSLLLRALSWFRGLSGRLAKSDLAHGSRSSLSTVGFPLHVRGVGGPALAEKERAPESHTPRPTHPTP